MAEVGPGEEEDDEVGDYDWGVEVVEDLGGLFCTLVYYISKFHEPMHTARKKSEMSCVV